MDPADPQYAHPPAAAGWAQSSTPAGAAARRTRAGVVVLVAVLTELVLIGVGANQWASERIVRHSADNGLAARLYAGSWLTYTWRWDPADGRIWWSEILLIATLAVVSGLLIWVVVRGPVSFARAFFGTWMAVIVATLLGAFVRGLLDSNTRYIMPRSNAVTRALFGPAGPNSETVLGAFALGLVVALFAALFAALTARRVEDGPAPYEPPGFADYGPPPAAVPGTVLPPWQDQHYGPPARPVTSPPAPHQADVGDQDARTTQLPSLDKEGERTQAMRPPAPDQDPGTQATTRLPPTGTQQPPTEAQLPPTEAQLPPTEAWQRPNRPDAPDQATSRFPRPPDDEALGHVED